MRIPRIYTTRELVSGITLLLEPEPSHHLTRVLRMEIGDALVLFDGRGGEYPAEITALKKKQVEVKTGELHEADCESPLQIHLGIAISRGERMDWIVQKSTELGVCAITPLFTEYTGVKLAGERADKKLRHWQQVAVSACEQCGRNRLPVVHPLLSLEDWLACTEADQKYVMHHRAKANDQADAHKPTSVALLVGPEGGMSDEEIASAEQVGFSSLRLGPRVLRTETAPLVAITIVQGRWGDI